LKKEREEIKEKCGKPNLRRHMWGLQAELMHDPTSFDTIGSSVPVEHQCLPHPYNLTCDWIQHRTILPCCFPISRCRSPIGSKSRGIFAVTEAEEVPFICVELSHLWTVTDDMDTSVTQILVAITKPPHTHTLRYNMMDIYVMN